MHVIFTAARQGGSMSYTVKPGHVVTSIKQSKPIKWKCTLKAFLLFNVIMIKPVSEISEPCGKNAHPILIHQRH
jgi:hypothetical protein